MILTGSGARKQTKGDPRKTLRTGPGTRVTNFDTATSWPFGGAGTRNVTANNARLYHPVPERSIRQSTLNQQTECFTRDIPQKARSPPSPLSCPPVNVAQSTISRLDTPGEAPRAPKLYILLRP